jgi:uncharacterized OB-fold protein
MEPMTGYQCDQCGRVFHPARTVCLGCGGRQFSEVPLEDKGTLVTFTRLHALPMDFQTRTLMLGIVEFPNGIRALGQLSVEEVEVGMMMRPRWEVVRTLDDRQIRGLRFYPAEG